MIKSTGESITQRTIDSFGAGWPFGKTKQNKMRKLKITSFDKEGVRGGRSLEVVLSEMGIDNCGATKTLLGEGEYSETETSISGETAQSDDDATATEEVEPQMIILQICRLSFTSTEKATAMGRLILSRVWAKIILEKTSGRFVSQVVQASVVSTRALQVKQHQRYDGIKWTFGIDWFPANSENENKNKNKNNACCPLEEVHFTGVRFRGGDELKFFRSLANGLSYSAASTVSPPNGRRPIGLRVLELNACKFLHPEIQYPIFFGGLNAACFGTLERLWMPKSPGLDDHRFAELFGEILLSSDNCSSSSSSSSSSIRELGFSYNGCGWKGSRAVSSFLRAPQSKNLKVLYLNRQHGELDLEGILRAAATRNGRLQVNLSQNYVSSLETLEQLRDAVTSKQEQEQFNESGDERNHLNNTVQSLVLDVQLDSMTFEVPETVIPGSSSNKGSKLGDGNENKGRNGRKSYEDHLQNLSQDEIAKLNVACGRVKYVLGRAAAACDQNNIHSSSPSQTNTGSFFSSLAALDCVLPDLLTILRLQAKQNAPKSHETEVANDGQQQTKNKRQSRNWLPTFLRKATKGNIEILKPWLLLSSDGNLASSTIKGGWQPVILSELEKDRMKFLWNEIEALHTNIAYHSGQRRDKHAGNSSGESSTTSNRTKTSRRKKYNRKGVAVLPMTPQENPVVREAYMAIPVIPTSILESADDASSCLSLPMKSNDEANLEIPESNGIRPAPPIFMDTAEELEKLRDDLFRRPPPHKIPTIVAVDSEWYLTQDMEGETQYSNPGGHPKRVKHRSMSVATLQIAYVDENKSPMVLRSFVIDLLSKLPGFQILAKEFVSWLFGSASCDTLVLGFAFGGDLRQLRKYAGITGNYHKNHPQSDSLASLEIVASRCLDIQRLLSSPEDTRNGRVPGLKKCAQHYFQKPLKKDDQTSDWRERPLRNSQLEYAALDAVILLVLLSQKKQEDEVTASSS